MNRRTFIKYTAGVLLGCVGLLQMPEVEKKVTVVPQKQIGTGVTQAQLQDLIQATLKDLPKMDFTAEYI